MKDQPELIAELKHIEKLENGRWETISRFLCEVERFITFGERLVNQRNDNGGES